MDWISICLSKGKAIVSIWKNNKANIVKNQNDNYFDFPNSLRNIYTVVKTLGTIRDNVKQQFSCEVKNAIIGIPLNITVEEMHFLSHALKLNGFLKFRFYYNIELQVAALISQGKIVESAQDKTLISQEGELAVFQYEDNVLEIIGISTCEDLKSANKNMRPLSFEAHIDYLPMTDPDSYKEDWECQNASICSYLPYVGGAYYTNKFYGSLELLILSSWQSEIRINNESIIAQCTSIANKKAVSIVDEKKISVSFYLYGRQIEEYQYDVSALTGNEVEVTIDIDVSKDITLIMKDKNNSLSYSLFAGTFIESSILRKNNNNTVLPENKSAIEKLLKIGDELFYSIESCKQRGDHATADGLEKILKNSVDDALFEYGISPVDSDPGDDFDSNFHNAVYHFEDISLKNNIVTKIYRRGYMKDGKVYRPCDVVVAN